MRFDGCQEIGRPAVMEKEHSLPESPKRGGAKLATCGQALSDSVGQTWTHLVEREVTIRLYRHLAHSTEGGSAGLQGLGMAEGTADRGKQLLAIQL